MRRLLLAAALALSLLTPAAALAQPASPGGIAGEPTGPKPHLLLFHGGSFLFADPNFQPLTVAPARAAGFVLHYVTYPLGDLPAAVLRARAEARRLRLKFGVERVYAYGSSAGGTLAALLAGDGLVAAAAAKAPVSDLVGWEWPLSAYGPDYYEQIGADLGARHRLSPLRRRAISPLLVLQGAGDAVVPAAMNAAFAAKFARVRLWTVDGGHTTERRRPWLIGRAMRWLAHEAALRARSAERKDSLP